MKIEVSTGMGVDGRGLNLVDPAAHALRNWRSKGGDVQKSAVGALKDDAANAVNVDDAVDKSTYSLRGKNRRGGSHVALDVPTDVHGRRLVDTPPCRPLCAPD